MKPAILYADRVTIYSPAASMVKSVLDLASVKDRRQQALLAFQLIEGVPDLLSQLNADPQTLEQLKAFLSMDPRMVRMAARAVGGVREVDEFYDRMGEISRVFEDQLPEAVERIKESTGAGDLLTAVEAGAVEIAELSGSPGSRLVANAVRAALGDLSGDSVDELVAGFTSRIVEMLTDSGSFPLLDASSASLARALEAQTGLEPSNISRHRSSEIRAAASFMGFLPYFPELPMDEVLDLRKELRNALVRFRAVMAEVSQEFEKRSIDADFIVEVEDAWRRRVEPALQEIRETLAEHGLLREAATVALGDPRRILVEAGGLFALAQGNVLALSRLLALGLAAAVPAADIAGRAILGVRAARKEVRSNAFYFLHRLGEAAERRS